MMLFLSIAVFGVGYVGATFLTFIAVDFFAAALASALNYSVPQVGHCKSTTFNLFHLQLRLLEGKFAVPLAYSEINIGARFLCRRSRNRRIDVRR